MADNLSALARSPKTPRAQGLLFCLGAFSTLWFMPETFKYTMVLTALPVGMLLAGRLSKFSRFAIAFGILALAIPGKDVVGDFIFFGLQHASVPLVATLLLGLATVIEAWRESESTVLAAAPK